MTSRMHACLALVLQEETSYRQDAGGPYVRKMISGDDGLRHPAYLDPGPCMLRTYRNRLVNVPTKPDGCAFDDDPHDTGGRTSMGILQREYDKWRSLRGLPCQDVWRIADHEVDAIFGEQYWQPLRCDEMPAGVDYAMVDFGFHCGIGKAAEKLQRLLGVKVDRHIGLSTLDALRRADAAEVVRELTREREAYHRASRTFWAHGRNWLQRTARVQARALAMVSAPTFAIADATPAAPPSPDPGTPSPSPDASRESGADSASGGKSITATAIGAGSGAMLVLQQANTAARETQSSGLGPLLLTLVSSWQFWAAALMLVTLLVVFREEVRRRLGLT